MKLMTTIMKNMIAIMKLMTTIMKNMIAIMKLMMTTMKNMMTIMKLMMTAMKNMMAIMTLMMSSMSHRPKRQYHSAELPSKLQRRKGARGIVGETDRCLGRGRSRGYR